MAPIYQDGSYLEQNPSWHQEDSPWKASQIRRILERNSLNPASICEIGCGAGEILNQLSAHYGDGKQFFGYEVSPQAYELCSRKTKPNLTFRLADLLSDRPEHFDVVLAIDVLEHVEDYFGFLRKLKTKAEYKIFHIPLELSVQMLLRPAAIMNSRRSVGHIQYFTKDTALATLRDVGYTIVDYFYTGGSIELPDKGWRAGLLRLPRKLAFSVSQDLAVRVLGGYSLLVLSK